MSDCSLDQLALIDFICYRSVTFSPEVELTINYKGKRVQMTHGPVMGLIMGLGQLNCSKIRLKKINYR